MLTEQQLQAIDIKRNLELNKPLTVAVMGQTGVGKSSLVNALFNTDLETGSIGPVTKTPQMVSLPENSNNPQIIFWDLPGIGESIEVDKSYLNDYLKVGQDADVVLWACHADSRSISLEASAIRMLINQLEAEKRKTFLSKIAFILTKSDLVAPEPWIAAKNDQKVQFIASPKTRELLHQKAIYFRNALISPFAQDIVTRTYYEGNFAVKSSEFQSDDNFIYYQGIVDEMTKQKLLVAYPDGKEVIERLYQNTLLTFCSARLRFNLGLLLRVIADRISPLANGRLSKFIHIDTIDQIEWEKAKTFSNVIVFDQKRKKIAFDISNLE